MKKFATSADSARLLLQPSGVEVVVNTHYESLQIISPVDGAALCLSPGETALLERFLYGLMLEAAREEAQPLVDAEVQRRLPGAVEAEIARRAQENER